MKDHRKTEEEVLRVYKTANPSTYWIEKNEEEYKERENFLVNLFLHRLNFPPKMFENAELLEFGTGTGEKSLFYLKWGASCLFVEMNDLACQRAEKLFKSFSSESARYQILNQSLFDFQSNREFDIVISLGVIQHTADKERAFKIKSQHLKEGGFLVLGVGNSAGVFQRNLQRAILYHLAKDEAEIVSLANQWFTEHIDRAVKFGGRSRESVIYDGYVNPKIDTPSVSEILGWFSQHGLKLYSSWPPVIPAILGDPANRETLPYEKLNHIMSLPEIVFLSHTDDDKDPLTQLNEELSKPMKSFEDTVRLLKDITPDTPLDVKSLKKEINSLLTLKFQVNPYRPFVDRLEQLLEEVCQVVKLLEDNRTDELKIFISNTQVLFRGTSGLGMNWYVGHKSHTELRAV